MCSDRGHPVRRSPAATRSMSSLPCANRQICPTCVAFRLDFRLLSLLDNAHMSDSSYTTTIRWTAEQFAALQAAAEGYPGMTPGRFAKWALLQRLDLEAPSAPEEAPARAAARQPSGARAGSGGGPGTGSAPASPRASSGAAPEARTDEPIPGHKTDMPVPEPIPGQVDLQEAIRMVETGREAPGPGGSVRRPRVLWAAVVRVLDNRGESGPKVAPKARTLIERGRVTVAGEVVTDPEAEIPEDANVAVPA